MNLCCVTYGSSVAPAFCSVLARGPGPPPHERQLDVLVALVKLAECACMKVSKHSTDECWWRGRWVRLSRFAWSACVVWLAPSKVLEVIFWRASGVDPLSAGAPSIRDPSIKVSAITTPHHQIENRFQKLSSERACYHYCGFCSLWLSLIYDNSFDLLRDVKGSILLICFSFIKAYWTFDVIYCLVLNEDSVICVNTRRKSLFLIKIYEVSWQDIGTNTTHVNII